MIRRNISKKSAFTSETIRVILRENKAVIPKPSMRAVMLNSFQHPLENVFRKNRLLNCNCDLGEMVIAEP